MKPIEYINKYKLNELDKFNHNLFIEDLTSDFLSLLELTKSKDGSINIKGFEQTLRSVRDKWDAIQRKTANKLPDKLWGYFFASFIVPMRDEFFPEEMQKRKEEKEAAYKQREARRQFYKEQYSSGFSSFRDHSNAFEDILNSLLKKLFKPITIPYESFDLLQLAIHCSKEDIINSFRQLSLKHHPDKGGNKDMFISIVEAKNKCLAYISNKK